MIDARVPRGAHGGEHDTPDDGPRPEPTVDWTSRRWAPWAVVALVVVLGLWAPGRTTLTVDEPLWLGRSDAFARAIGDGDFDRATSRQLDSSATMPGVTTMVAGVIGRRIAQVTAAVGISDDVTDRSEASPQVLRASRAVITVWCALGLGLLAVLAARVIGRRAALVAVIVLACEPYLLGHLGVLHTDGLVTVFGAVSVVALMAALWAPRAGPRSGLDVPTLAISAGAGGLALLTKLTAVALLGSAVGAIVAVELARAVGRRRAGPGPTGADAGVVVRATATTLSAWLLGAVATVIVLWPALWTSPMGQIDALRESAEIADQSIPLFFRGEVGPRPGQLFLPLSTAFRMSPWLFVGGVAATVWGTVAVARREVRGPRARVIVALALGPVPYLLYLGGQTKIYDRYALPLWPFTALLLGIAVDHVVGATTPHRARVAARIGLAAVAVAALLAAAAAPYRTSYVSPLFGGQTSAVEQIPLGWGEGIEQLGATVARREEGRCDEVVVRVRPDFRSAFPCGVLETAEERLPPDDDHYLVRQVASRQVPIFDLGTPAVLARGELVDRVEIGGVAYAELWLIAPPTG